MGCQNDLRLYLNEHKLWQLRKNLERRHTFITLFFSKYVEISYSIEMNGMLACNQYREKTNELIKTNGDSVEIIIQTGSLAAPALCRLCQDKWNHKYNNNAITFYAHANIDGEFSSFSFIDKKKLSIQVNYHLLFWEMMTDDDGIKNDSYYVCSVKVPFNCNNVCKSPAKVCVCKWVWVREMMWMQVCVFISSVVLSNRTLQFLLVPMIIEISLFPYVFIRKLLLIKLDLKENKIFFSSEFS